MIQEIGGWNGPNYYKDAAAFRNGTNVFGRALGRFVPWVGWDITIHDGWTIREGIWQFTVDFHNSGQEFYADNPTYFPR